MTRSGGNRPERILLLGSGACAVTLHPYNAPTSVDFGRVLGEKVHNWPERFPFLNKAVRYLSEQSNLHPTSWALDAVWNGIDENYKLRGLVRAPEPRWPANVPSDKRLYLQRPPSWDSFWTLAGWELKRAVTEVYGRQLEEAMTKADLRLKWIARQFDELRPDVIVTTNYDLLAEAIARVYWPQAGNCIRNADFLDRDNVDRDAAGPTIIKLHGSLDWVFATSWQTGLNQGTNYVERTQHGLSMKDDEIDLHEDGWERRPLLVGPVKYKDEFLVPGSQPKEVVEVLSAQWARFMGALEDANELRVFGYRFPAEDAYGNRILQEAVRPRRRDRTLRILLYLPSGPLPDHPGVCEDEDVENRLKREIFFRPGSAEIKRCGPIPG